MSDSAIAAIITGTFTLLIVVVRQMFSVKNDVTSMKRDIADVNDAVNHRHESGGDRLYDSVQKTAVDVAVIKTNVHKLDKWREGYEASPWNSGKGVEDWLERNEKRIRCIEQKLDE